MATKGKKRDSKTRNAGAGSRRTVSKVSAARGGNAGVRGTGRKSGRKAVVVKRQNRSVGPAKRRNVRRAVEPNPLPGVPSGHVSDRPATDVERDDVDEVDIERSREAYDSRTAVDPDPDIDADVDEVNRDEDGITKID